MIHSLTDKASFLLFYKSNSNHYSRKASHTMRRSPARWWCAFCLMKVGTVGSWSFSWRATISGKLWGAGGWRRIGFGCRPAACGILVPRPGIEPVSPAQERGLLTSGPPELSLTSPAVNGLSCTSGKPLCRCCPTVFFLPSSHLWQDSRVHARGPVPATTCADDWDQLKHKGPFFFFGVFNGFFFF